MSDLGPRRSLHTPRTSAHDSSAQAPASLGSTDTPFEYPSIDGLARLMASLVGDSERDPTTFITRCGWCRRFGIEGRWLDLDEAAKDLKLDEDGLAPTITHGICEECVASFERALDDV